jgi:hypothetical protein
MSQTPQPQAPSPRGETGAPIYTRKELERRIRRLDIVVLRGIVGKFSVAEAHLNSVADSLWSIADEAKYVEFMSKVKELKEYLKDVVDELVIKELKLDVDIDKYEKQYNVKFRYETERQLGVALVKEDNEVKPVVVWTDYSTIGYTEGEKREGA